jgi:tetratricopeptide (TPR) repeat protein
MMLVYFLAGDVAVQEGRKEDAKANYYQSLQVEEALHHPQHRARILISLGSLLASLGDRAGALHCHREALDLATEVGDRHRQASALVELGADLRMVGDPDQAKSCVCQALRSALELGARPLLMRCLLELGRIEAKAGNKQRAQHLASILAGAELGPLNDAYAAFVRELRWTPLPGEMTPEAVAHQIVEEADLAPLLL